ncbi:hypothetical protein Tco_0640141 [Tanacetum coccineum]
MEVEGFEPPQEEVIPVRRSVRTHRAPNRLFLNVEVEEHSLGDLNEPTNYKAIMLDLESNKWLDAMNAEMKSMKDNQVWTLVNLSPNGFLHLASSMKLFVVVLVVLELVVELVLALGPELVLEFAPVKLGLSQLVLQSAPLGLQLVSAQVHVESVVVQLESSMVHLAIQTI